MKLLMISGDKGIMDEKSDVRRRMQAYARMCDELHIVVLASRVHADHREGNLFLYPVSGNAVIRRFAAYSTARRIASQRKMDVITAQSPDELGLIAYLVARSFGIALQLQVHTDILSPWYRRAGIIPRMKYVLARYLLPRASCVRVVSWRIADSLSRELHIQPSAVSVVPIALDMHKFASSKSSKSKGRNGDNASCTIVSAGRYVEKEKNFSMLIRAMVRVAEKYPRAKLVIVGDGPDKEYYQSLISALRLGRNVFLEPWRTDIEAILPSFDLFALPSYIEGWGMAVVEAMAVGVPVVMTDVGVAGEIVHDRVNGRVVPVGDQEAFAQALIDMCGSPEDREVFARSARETIDKLTPHTYEAYLDQWRKSFDCCKV
ncbi:MAG: glycosyltransferase [bacterium]|nr:glycosyltransferase [bacterium]MDZ4286135.1 glycosyltransferase [Candidatus Sungbacteria bacterium]